MNRFLIPPRTFPGSLFEVILAPIWHQVGTKGGFWRVGKRFKKHAKKGNASKIGSDQERPEMPPWVPLRIKNQNQIQIQAQVHRTIKGPRDTPLRAAHGGGYTHIYINILVRGWYFLCTGYLRYCVGFSAGI